MTTIVHYTDAVEFGGAERMLLTLAEELDRRRWRSLLFYHPTPAAARLVAEAGTRGIEMVPVPHRKGKLDLTALRMLVRELRRVRPAVFHAHLAWPLRCSMGLTAAFLARIPCSVATQQLFAPLRSRRRRQRQRAVSVLVDRYIAVSNAMAAQLAPTLLNGRKVSVVHNGIDVTPFDTSRDTFLRACVTGGSPCPLILSVARLDRQKGLRTLIAAAEQVPGAIFAVAGEGPERPELEAEVASRRLGERFRFLGHRTDIPDLLAACDAFVLPSLFEGLPVAILEAMAARKPVVASAVDGNNEALEHGATGLLVPATDPSALASAIRRVLADDLLARRLGAAGRTRVEEKFTVQVMTSSVERIYQELLSNRVHPSLDKVHPERSPTSSIARVRNQALEGN